MKLSAPHQQFLFEVRPDIFQPCPVGVGMCSFVDLSQVEESELVELVVEAWSTVAPKRVIKAFGEAVSTPSGAPFGGENA